MQLPLAYALLQNPTVKASVSMVTAYYIRVSEEAVVSVLIIGETEISSNCIRCLAMDVRVDSCNQPLSGTPHYNVFEAMPYHPLLRVCHAEKGLNLTRKLNKKYVYTRGP
jgi:hypothetical protein